MPPTPIPVILLKTRSTPHDAYLEYFSSSKSTDLPFQPIFVPVLEHRKHVQNLQEVKEMLRSGQLSEKYGGMIFTSQRAVEGWADVVSEIEREREMLEGSNVKRTREAEEVDGGMVCCSLSSK
jgi:hypothetical protein